MLQYIILVMADLGGNSPHPPSSLFYTEKIVQVAMFLVTTISYSSLTLTNHTQKEGSGTMHVVTAENPAVHCKKRGVTEHPRGAIFYCFHGNSMGYHGNSKILLPWGVPIHRIFYSVVM